MVAEMTSYTVYVDRDETMWRVRVPELGRTTAARNLGEVEAMARDLIALMTDQESAAFELTVTVGTLSPAAEIVDRARAHRAQAEELSAMAAAEIREAAHELRSAGLTVRDIARVLDVSAQRASQLLSRGRELAKA
jgi:hypothetical protein